jgi:hypothetical protein
MPSPRSRECWKPAVPPPPVAGAAVENGLGVGEGLGVGPADGVAVCVIVGLADGAGVGPTLALGVTLVVPLGALVGVADPVAPGEIAGGDAAGGDPEQPETAVAADMAKAAQPTTVSLARRPVRIMVLRIFMAPPPASRRWRSPVSAGGHKGKAHRRHRHAMACSSLEIRLRGQRDRGKTPACWAALRRPFPRTQAQRYRLGEEQGER